MAETVKMDLYVAKKLIRELNAEELKRKWEKHLKKQGEKCGRNQDNPATNRRNKKDNF